MFTFFLTKEKGKEFPYGLLILNEGFPIRCALDLTLRAGCIVVLLFTCPPFGLYHSTTNRPVWQLDVIILATVISVIHHDTSAVSDDQQQEDHCPYEKF